MILMKEEFVGGEKWRRAVKLGGYEAIGMWLAMKCYCSQHPSTEGFVPDEDVEELLGAPRRPRKALEALMGCGRLLPGGERGAGLVEAAPGGWLLHDYLDHSESPEALELRRAKARLKQRRYRDEKRRELEAVRRETAELGPGETPRAQSLPACPPSCPPDCPPSCRPASPGDRRGQNGDARGDEAGDIDGDRRQTVTGDASAGARPRPPAPARALARGRAHPNPPQPSPIKIKSGALAGRDPEARARAEPPSELGAAIGIWLGEAPPSELRPAVAPFDPDPEHIRFASEHELDLAAIVAEVRGERGAAALSSAELLARLAQRLIAAAGERGAGAERGAA